jgi:hypothetical protein
MEPSSSVGPAFNLPPVDPIPPNAIAAKFVVDTNIDPEHDEIPLEFVNSPANRLPRLSRLRNQYVDVRTSEEVLLERNSPVRPTKFV